jgi:hypothetical protein
MNFHPTEQASPICRFATAILMLVFFALAPSVGMGQVLNPDARPSIPTNRVDIGTRDRKNQAISEMDRLEILRRIRSRPGQDAVSAAEEKARLAEMRRPSAEDLARHHEFLKQDHTGIVRIFPDEDCESTFEVRAGGACAFHLWGGSEFSFRSRDASADIKFNKGQLIGGGFFSQGILSDLGDVPIESVTRDTVALGNIGAFKPAKDVKEAREASEGFRNGVLINGATYSESHPAKVNTTYILRIIAYKNSNQLLSGPRRRERLAPKFFLVQSEPRGDLLVTFRIIRADRDGALTMIWKLLSRKGSPEINFGKKQPLEDIK